MSKISFSESVKDQINGLKCKKDETLSPFAFKSRNAERFHRDQEDVRPSFFHDIDRILYSQAYTRYIDKTQVFYLIENDHITHRVLHVQLVSKIARTIGLFLNLNQDLIEAISLGHDVGHSPFGHNGETIISNFCQENSCGIFEHNVQSFRLFHELERNGKGVNLSVQVLDGIICHNGEIITPKYEYNSSKDKIILLSEYNNSLLKKGISSKMKPMTLEGCVMRISDVIAYVGRDIEDAIELKLIQRKDIPKGIVELLGNNNRSIINSLITDLVENSYGKDYLEFSNSVFGVLQDLKRWNEQNIYNNEKKKVQDGKISKMFNIVLDTCLEDLNTNTNRSRIKEFTEKMDPSYIRNNHNYARIVADYVSGMTDDYLLNTFKEIIMPRSFGINFDNSHDACWEN